MALQAGRVLHGRSFNFQLENSLAGYSTVFKARVLPKSRSPAPPQWAVVKTAFTRDRQSALKLEHQNYTSLPSISRSQYIRSLVDVIGNFETMIPEDPPCLALEWMDHTLADFDSVYFQQYPQLLQAVAWHVLKALSTLKKHNLIHSDVKHENILISNIGSPHPIIKLGDLGTTTLDGFNKDRIQSLACRAPEVWQGKGCFHTSDVWSLGVTLTDCVFPHPIFGTKDNHSKQDPEVWCVAKLMRLFNGLPSPVDKYRESEFRLAAMFAHPDAGYIKIGSLTEELQQLNLPPALSNFMESLLVVDESKRPAADDALRDQFFQTAL